MRYIWRKSFQVRITVKQPLIITAILKPRGAAETHSQFPLTRQPTQRKREEVTQPGRSEALKAQTLTIPSFITA